MVRKATFHDVRTIVEYISKKAEFDRQLGCFEGTIAATPERIAKALFGVPVFAYSIFAIRDGRTVGFAFYHFQFSSFQGRPKAEPSLAANSAMMKCALRAQHRRRGTAEVQR